jgi:hypothetical protein
VTLCAALLWLGFFIGAAEQVTAQVTTLTVTDEVLVEDVMPFGMNIGGDNHYDSPVLKDRIRNGGFEGIEYRHLYFTYGGDGETITAKAYRSPWNRLRKGARYTYVNGPLAGEGGTITDFEFVGKKEIRLSVDGPAVDEISERGRIVMLVEYPKEKTSVGYVGQHGGPLWLFTEGQVKVTTETGDVHKGSPGRHAAVVRAAAGGHAVFSWPVARGDYRGRTWRVRFWAKGEGKLSMGWGEWKPSEGSPTVPPQQVPISDRWQSFEYEVQIPDYPYSVLCLHLTASDGTVKIDEVECVLQGEKNRTAFKDRFVDALRQFRPGIIRRLQMGGASMRNWLSPKAARMPYTSRRNTNPVLSNEWPGHPKTNSGSAASYAYGAHELLDLCREVDATPWLCTPGTIRLDEIDHLIEFLAGPADSEFGGLRATQGQRRPWTEEFDQIIVE